jgi:ankyrin repeat protein
MGWLINRALCGAIINEDLETIQLSLDRGADPNTYHKGITPLMWACLTDNSLVIKAIIDAGGDPKKLDKKSQFDTYQFCRNNNLEGAIDYIDKCISINESKKALGIDPKKHW